MAAAQLRRERHGNGARKVGLGEVVDVVVLGDDEALPLTFGSAVDLTVELQDHAAAFEREFGRIEVRQIDQRSVAAGIDMTELPARGPCRQVGDDVELLARRQERAFECEVVARGDEQLVGHPALA